MRKIKINENLYKIDFVLPSSIKIKSIMFLYLIQLTQSNIKPCIEYYIKMQQEQTKEM